MKTWIKENEEALIWTTVLSVIVVMFGVILAYALNRPKVQSDYVCIPTVSYAIDAKGGMSTIINPCGAIAPNKQEGR
jgi:cation transporter-like permease